MLQKLKKLYSRIVPASKYQVKRTANTVNGEIRSLGNTVAALNKKIEETHREVSELHELQERLDLMDQALKQFKTQNETENLLLTENLKEISNEMTQQFSAVLQSRESCIENLKTTADTLNQNIGTMIRQKSELLKHQLENLSAYSYTKYLYFNEYERRVIQSFHDMYHRPDYREHFLALISGLEKEDIDKIVRILKRQQDLEETGGHIDLFTEEEQQQIKTMLKSFEQEIFQVDDEFFIYKNYRLPVNHFEASVFYYRHGLDEVRNIAYTREKDIVDVGGFIGDSVLVLEPYTTKKIYTFEAVKSNFELLQKTIRLNGLKNVVAENLALGKEPDTLEIQVAGSASTLMPDCPSTVLGTEQVKVIRFDDYVKEHHLHVGLIKIDIEGAEQDFLAGAKETIISQKPILLCSIYHNADDFFHIKPLLESWNVGYRFHIHKPVDKSVSREVLLIAEVDE